MTWFGSATRFLDQWHQRLPANCMDYIRRCQQDPPSPGPMDRREIGDGIVALEQSYQTRSEPRFEGHRRHYDIQYILAGDENILVCPPTGLQVSETYDDERDIIFFQTPTDWSTIRAPAGTIVILGPEDIHSPNMAPTEAAPTAKTVLKVPVGFFLQ